MKRVIYGETFRIGSKFCVRFLAARLGGRAATELVGGDVERRSTKLVCSLPAAGRMTTMLHAAFIGMHQSLCEREPCDGLPVFSMPVSTIVLVAQTAPPHGSSHPINSVCGTALESVKIAVISFVA